MGSMSASDAAPLPRLGEVFFDVRGSSRSMRLSWYADTGIAVFSIWQGGTCTGTFRLPMDDLSRLMESLRRGMQGAQDGPQDSREIPGGQRPRLAIGAAPEPYTGALLALGGAPLPLPGDADGRGSQADGPAVPSGYGAEPAYLSDYRDQRPPDGQGRSYGDGQGYGAVPAYGDGPGYGDGLGYGNAQGYGEAPSAADAQAPGGPYSHSQGYSAGPAYDAQGYEVPGYEAQGYEAPGYAGASPGYGDGRVQHNDPGPSYSPAQAYGEGRSYAPEQGFPDARPYAVAALGGDGSASPNGPGYPAAGRAEQGYDAHGYDAQGYAGPGYAEQVPAAADYPEGRLHQPGVRLARPGGPGVPGGTRVPGGARIPADPVRAGR